MPGKRQLATLRKRLEEDLRSSRASIGEIDDELTDLKDFEEVEGGVPTNHMADVGTSVYDRERLMTIEQEMRDRVTAIQEAIERMDNGAYGTCQRCGREIPFERLEAMPYSQYCVECQQAVDDQADETGLKEQQPLQP